MYILDHNRVQKIKNAFMIDDYCRRRQCNYIDINSTTYYYIIQHTVYDILYLCTSCILDDNSVLLFFFNISFYFKFFVDTVVSETRDDNNRRYHWRSAGVYRQSKPTTTAVPSVYCAYRLFGIACWSLRAVVVCT